MIGEFFTGLITVVSEVFKPVVTVLETVVGGVAKCGSYVAGKVSDFIRMVDPNCGGICETIDEAGKFLNNVGDFLLNTAFDLKIPELKDCTNEDLGARTLLPETRNREIDESASNYIDYLKTVDFNKAEFDNWSPEKKIASSTVGNALITEAIKEKTGVEIPADFVANIEKAEVKHEEAAAFIEKFSEEGKESMSEMNDYLKNAPNMTEEKTAEMKSLATETLKELNPEMTDEQVSERIKDIKAAVQE